MKKVFIVLFLFLFCFSFSFASLINIYKKGEIRVTPDPEFGKNTEWDEMFYKGIKSIAFASDGSFFVTALGGISHSVYKFDKNGNFIKKFGRKGRGPGDLYHPGNLSILDNKYLLIGEYATSRRISVFDLNGNFVKIIRTKDSVFDIVGLNNGNFAILCKRFGKLNEFFVYKRDISSNNKKHVISFSEKARHCSVQAPKYYGDVFIRRMKNGEFLVGFNNSNKINIYNFKGVKIKSFNINIKKTKITKGMKEEFYTIMERVIKKKPGIKPTREEIKEMRSMMRIFPKYAPYYEKIIIDDDGNILVFYHNRYAKVESCKFQIYSSDGKYITDSKVNLGKYQYYKKKGLPMVFNKNSIYFYPEKNDIDDENLSKVIRVRLR